ncbi:hypothetical protein ACHAWF_001254 [Thalassiosira exigua]
MAETTGNHTRTEVSGAGDAAASASASALGGVAERKKSPTPATPKQSKQSKRSKQPKAQPEKRLKRFRSKPTIAISERIERAVAQRLYLVDASSPSTCPYRGGPSLTLTVLGSVGNVYRVTVSKVPSCDCPDRNKGNLCKHLLFVMLKVAGLPVSSPLVYQSAYLTEELEEIVGRMQQRMRRLGRDVVANETVRRRHEEIQKGLKGAEEVEVDVKPEASSVKRQEVEGVDCPICFDSLGSDLLRLTYCRGTCGTNFHAECIEKWTRQAGQRGNPTCPNCRQPWEDDRAVSAGKASRKRAGVSEGRVHEGYENLGDLQGQSLVRDTSTYHSYEWHGYRKRRRY